MTRPLRAPIPFPGRVIREGRDNSTAPVLAIQRRLNELGCGPVDENGKYDGQTPIAVKLFQSRFTDADGLPLEIDGMVGPLTWGALFGAQSVPITHEAP